MPIYSEPGASTDAEILVTAPVTATLTLEMTVGPAQTNVSQGTGVLEAGARQWVLVKVDLAAIGAGFAVDPTQYAVALAITQADPLPATFAAGEWLTRALDPAGVYAKVLVGPGGSLVPGTGHWRVYVQIQAGGEVLETRAPGYLIVE